MGANVALTVTELSGAMTEPTAGRPVNPNGAGAGVTPVIVTGVAPMLARLTAALTGVPPAGAPPKLMTGGVGWSSPVGLIPVEVTGTLTVRTFVVNVISLLAAPATVGVKRTGTVTVCPTGSSIGSPLRVGFVADGAPTANAGLPVVILVIPRSVVARNVRLAVVVRPTAVAGTASGPPVSGWVTGEPNESSLPSSVPT